MSHSIVVCRPAGRYEEIVRSPRGEKWCFVCRERVPFFHIVQYPTQKEDLWYGHYESIECQDGHTDGDLFPGRRREWEY